MKQLHQRVRRTAKAGNSLRAIVLDYGAGHATVKLLGTGGVLSNLPIAGNISLLQGDIVLVDTSTSKPYVLSKEQDVYEEGASAITEAKTTVRPIRNGVATGPVVTLHRYNGAVSYFQSELDTYGKDHNNALSMALSEASSGDVIVVPPQDFTNHVIVPESITILGTDRKRSRFLGGLTLANNSRLSNLTVSCTEYNELAVLIYTGPKYTGTSYGNNHDWCANVYIDSCDLTSDHITSTQYKYTPPYIIDTEDGCKPILSNCDITGQFNAEEYVVFNTSGYTGTLLWQDFSSSQGWQLSSTTFDMAFEHGNLYIFRQDSAGPVDATGYAYYTLSSGPVVAEGTTFRFRQPGYIVPLRDAKSIIVYTDSSTDYADTCDSDGYWIAKPSAPNYGKVIASLRMEFPSLLNGWANRAEISIAKICKDDFRYTNQSITPSVQRYNCTGVLDQGESSIEGDHRHAGEAVFTSPGALNTAGGTIRIYNQMERTVTISKVFLSVGTAPAGADITVDVHKNGTTIFTTQTYRPVIEDGSYTGYSTTIEVSSWAHGEYLTVDIDTVGLINTGADLTVHVVYV